MKQVFQRARDSTPCIIFSDKIDTLYAIRTLHDDDLTTRAANQLLTEIDGVKQTIASKRVHVMAATNRMIIFDPAILHPGRLDKHIYNGTRPTLASAVNLQSISDDE